MKYNNCYECYFVSRPNRFEAYVSLEGRTELVHVKNTGRCKELLLPGAKVYLEKSDNEARKTKYDLIAVEKQGLGIVNIDSQAPNKLMLEYLNSEKSQFGKLDYIKPEYTYGKSRIDFYAEKNGKRILIEVKGCTLERANVGYFPDAPSDRAVKHLKELMQAQAEGYECYIAFVITMPKVRQVLGNYEIHALFAETLKKAEREGVQILNLPCEVKIDEVFIKNRS